MSARNKLQKFAENLSFLNVFENFDAKSNVLLGKDGEQVINITGWDNFYFKNQNPLILELACGRGEYSLAMANDNPELNFIGIDVKGARIWQGASKALELGLHNVAFLRTRIENIENFFIENEISEIWITFPDPFLKKSKSNRRLTSSSFIEKYRKFLINEGIVHLKTDSPELYKFTLEIIEHDEKCKLIYTNPDIYSSDLAYPELNTKTYYEKKHLSEGKKIKYIRFTIN